MTPITDHFSLEELTFSQQALRTGLDNTPSLAAVDHLHMLCVLLLEPIRSLLGCPLHVDSGYRSPALNAAIGGAAQSAHMSGRAADILPIGPDLHAAFEAIKVSGLPFDQLIIECGAWIHVSIPDNGDPARQQCLAASGSPGHWTYEVA